MKLSRIFSRRFDLDAEGVNVRAAVNAVVAANVDERSGTVAASSEQHAGEQERESERKEQSHE